MSLLDTTVKDFLRYFLNLLHNTVPKRKAPGYTVYGSTVLNSSAAFSASLYIIAKTKKRAARQSGNNNKCTVSLAPSAAQLTQVGGSTRKMYGTTSRVLTKEQWGS